MNESFDTERRKDRRLELTNLVAYRNFDIQQVTETVNISMGGMQIKTEFAIEKDETLDVSLQIGGERFTSTARVIYCNPRDDQDYEVGLRFEKTSERDLALLNQYLCGQNE